MVEGGSAREIILWAMQYDLLAESFVELAEAFARSAGRDAALSALLEIDGTLVHHLRQLRGDVGLTAPTLNDVARNWNEVLASARERIQDSPLGVH
jgi:hypothetical protein